MERLRCVVDRITYANEKNGYTVLKIRVKNYSDTVAAVGNMAGVHVGSVLTLMGEWRIDGRYGRQFSVSSWEETLPATVLGLERYLGSGMIKVLVKKSIAISMAEAKYSATPTISRHAACDDAAHYWHTRSCICSQSSRNRFCTPWTARHCSGSGTLWLRHDNGCRSL